MKKFISLIMILVVLTSTASGAALAINQNDKDTIIKVADTIFKDSTDDNVKIFFAAAAYEMAKRNLITTEQGNKIIEILNSTNANSDSKSNPTVYTFGKGTFIVGIDLKAGTYNIFCESTDQDDYSNSMNSFGDLYTQYGMQEYADAFSSLGDLTDSLRSITVTTYSSKGLIDKYYTLKLNESARIILTDGMQLEIKGGSAKLEFLR